MAEKRGQLDGLLDVELILAPTDVANSPSGGADHQSGGSSPPATEAGRARPSAADLAPGSSIGKYRLDRLLGAGGMGAVWDARDTDLDRRVALKVLRRDDVGAARGRLVREARAMALLRHPNVITVFDAATIDGRHVIAMELVTGETLASWLERAHRPGEIIATLVAAGRGLAAAHAANLVHRDFKPHNVLVDERRRVVVTDFGLARAVGEPAAADTVPDLPSSARERDPHAGLGALDSPLTATGAVLGTPAYMAPEQLAGLVADERADQFSFCVTLWEALAGRRPFPGDTLPAIAAALASGELRDANRVPRRLRAVLARGLDLEPAARWPSMDALLNAITRRWRRLRRIAIGVAAVAACAIAFAAYVALARPAAPTWRPEIVNLPAFEENSDAPAISPDGSQIAYVSDREQTGSYRAYVMPLTGGESRAVTPPGDSFQMPRWTRDGKSLLLVHWSSVTSDYRIMRQPVEGGPVVDLGPGLGVDDCGGALAIAEADRAMSRLVLQRAPGDRTTLASSSTQWIIQPRCDPSGQRILFTRGASGAARAVDDLYIIDRERHELALTSGNASTNGAFTPDGRSVVFSSMRNDKVQLYEVPATGGAVHQLTFENGPHLGPDVSPDGRVLAFDEDATAMIVIAGGAGATRKVTSKREWLVAVTPTRDGASLIACRLGDQGGEVVVISTSDGHERVLARGLHPFPSSDDRRVIFGGPDANRRLLSIAIEGGPITEIARLPGNLDSGTDGPDGQHVEVEQAGKIESWHVGLDGRLERDDAEGLVIPAPRGGWRAVRSAGAGTKFRFVAPGAALTSSQHDVVSESVRPTWLDDHRIAYAARGAFHVVDVTTGAELSTVPAPDATELAILAADGVHWYDVRLVGHVTRHLIVNFADRPWK